MPPLTFPALARPNQNFVIFCLTKILRPEKFRQANDLGAFFRCLANEFNRAREILLRLWAAAPLNERNLRCLCHSEINHEGHEGHEKEDVRMLGALRDDYLTEP